jgi:16S rRNA (cytosine1402-N4)-methyltransferase
MYITTHKSVLVQEVIDFLIVHNGGIYIDATLGGGGHTQALLKNDKVKFVFGIDWDQQSVDQYGKPLQEQYPDKFKPVWGSFAHLYKIIKKEKINTIDGILADFGTSQMQIHEKEGFSFAQDTPLDMRTSTSHFGQTAADVVNGFSEHALTKFFWEYGQERFAKKIAHAIVLARKVKKIKTTGRLVEVVLSVAPWHKKSTIHPATKIFQALRILVNQEMDNIHAFLIAAFEALAPKGRLVCISFHSLEDEKIKHFFKEKADLGLATVITKKVVTASKDELKNNPSARSAKLRVLEKL